jgi:hypothetical protein
MQTDSSFPFCFVEMAAVTYWREIFEAELILYLVNEAVAPRMYFTRGEMGLEGEEGSEGDWDVDSTYCRDLQ